MRISVLLIILIFETVSYGTYVDLESSQLTWTGGRVIGKHFGKLPFKSVSVELNRKNKIKSGVFLIDISAFTVDDIVGKKGEKFKKHLKGKDFFEIKRWPTAKLNIKKMKRGKASGELTIKGKTRPVEFNYVESKDNIYTGILKFNRTEFGVIYASKNFFKNIGAKAIKDEVTVEFRIKMKE